MSAETKSQINFKSKLIQQMIDLVEFFCSKVKDLIKI